MVALPCPQPSFRVACLPGLAANPSGVEGDKFLAEKTLPQVAGNGLPSLNTSSSDQLYFSWLKPTSPIKSSDQVLFPVWSVSSAVRPDKSEPDEGKSHRKLDLQGSQVFLPSQVLLVINRSFLGNINKRWLSPHCTVGMFESKSMSFGVRSFVGNQVDDFVT